MKNLWFESDREGEFRRKSGYETLGEWHHLPANDSSIFVRIDEIPRDNMVVYPWGSTLETPTADRLFPETSGTVIFHSKSVTDPKYKSATFMLDIELKDVIVPYKGREYRFNLKVEDEPLYECY